MSKAPETIGIDLAKRHDKTMLTLMVDGRLDFADADTPWGQAVVSLLAERDAAIARAEKAEAACVEWSDVSQRNYQRAKAALQWQPIETAPKDGTEFLGSVGVSYQGGVVVLHWDKDDGFIDWDADFWDPTHWMPLPPPPETP